MAQIVYEDIDLGIEELYPKQFDAFFCDHRIAVCEASTKSGKTHAAMVWILLQAKLGPDNVNHWWVAPTYSQAEIAYTRTVDALRGTKLIRSFTDASGRMSITLDNGAVIRYRTGEKPDNLYGDDVYSLVMDEASRCREEAWHACRSTLTYTRGPIRMIGNVHGRGWFWKMCRRIEAKPDADECYHRIDWRDAVAAGVLDVKEIESARRDLPEMRFRELYEAVASEDGGNPFGIEAIGLCVGPMSPHEPVAFGVDLAKSTDYTVVIGLDAAGNVCRYHRWSGINWKDTVERIRPMLGNVRTFMDSTGVGDPIIDFLRFGRPVYRDYEFFRERAGSNYDYSGLAMSDVYNRIVDFNFNRRSKQRLMEGLAVAIQNRLIQFPDGAIREEMESFHIERVQGNSGVVQDVYKAPAGFYDDCVCSLALAVECWSRPVSRVQVIL